MKTHRRSRGIALLLLLPWL